MKKETRGVKPGTKRGKYHTPKIWETTMQFAIPEARKKELQSKYPEGLQSLFDEWQKKL